LDHPFKGVSNAKLRAVIERPVFIVAPPRSGGTAEEGSDAATDSFVLPEAVTT
jgi:hypothetical protein